MSAISATQIFTNAVEEAGLDRAIDLYVEEGQHGDVEVFMTDGEYSEDPDALEYVSAKWHPNGSWTVGSVDDTVRGWESDEEHSSPESAAFEAVRRMSIIMGA